MKIVFLAPFGIRPKGTVIARMLPLAGELQNIGHTVTIIAPPYTNPEDSGKVEVVRGVRLANVTLPSCGKALGALLLAWRMFRATLAEKPDIVHLFKPKGYGGLAAMLMLSLRRAGIHMPVLCVDTDDWEGKGGMNDLHAYSPAEKRLFAFQEQWLSRHSVGMTVASRELECLTKGLGVPVERIFYLPNCVEDVPPGDGARVRKKLGIDADVPVVLLYTRFFEFAQNRLHRVFAETFRRVPSIRFLVVGKGRHGEEDQLLRASREMGFAPALAMAGWLEPEDIPDYLAAADVAIYPLDDTVVNRAKCPAKLIEVIRAGIPVVVDRVGQATEYMPVVDSDLLCAPGNGEEMVEKIVTLLRDRDKSQLLGRDGRRSLLLHYNWKDVAKGLDSFYRSFL